jgi:molybdenum cofactor cytidylyltransferase
MGLSLAQSLRLLEAGTSGLPATRAVAFVGSGGKTTAIFRLARQLPEPVIVTTTTHLGAWQTASADRHIVARHAGDLPEAAADGVTLVTGPLATEERYSSPPSDVLGHLHENAGRHGYFLLIEADGSRQKPLKAPAPHEPAIPPFADLVVVVAGLTGLGRPLSADSIHRPERFSALSALKMGQPVTAEALARVLCQPEGGLKGIPPEARRAVLLTQAEAPELQAQARGMVPALLGSYQAVIIADEPVEEVHAVHEPVAGIVLAAGGSTRLGRPKPLLDWHGQPFVRAVAITSLSAGLSPVIVVTGSEAEDVARAFADLPVAQAYNPAWPSGQASSIRTGLQAVPASTGAAIFLLADQPQIHFDVIQALVDTHAAGLPPIVAPLVMMERRANPVLFDRVAFPDLLALEGDVGGRAVFSKYRVEFMPWHDDRLLLDVDTEADYRRLTEDDTL